ncbi:unnamed protein product [Absidia cylindrospora]
MASTSKSWYHPTHLLVIVEPSLLHKLHGKTCLDFYGQPNAITNSYASHSLAFVLITVIRIL